MYLECNLHAATFVKGDTYDEYDDVRKLYTALNLSGEYTFCYTYPLSTAAFFKRELTPNMTGEDILVIARMDYETIYKTEIQATSNPGHIPGTLNRKTTAGPFGIWGHDFSDLYFEGIGINISTKAVVFNMGS